jgi:hypothetical protein
MSEHWALSNDQHIWVTFLIRQKLKMAVDRYDELVEHATREDAICHARSFLRHYGTVRRSNAAEIVSFGAP